MPAEAHTLRRTSDCHRVMVLDDIEGRAHDAPAAEAPAGTEPSEDRAAALGVGAICLAMFAAGLVGLQSRDMWLDESLSLGAARNLVHSLLNDGSSMGPYLAFLKPWSWVSTSAAWLRLPSLLAAVGTVPVLYAIGRKVGSARFALMASTFLALSWLAARYEQEARAYAVVMLLATVTWLALIHSVRRGPDQTGRWWSLYAVATIVMVLTHGLGILQFGAQLVVLAVAPEAMSWLRKVRPILVASGVAMLAMIVPGGGEAPQWIQPLSASQVFELYRQLTGASTAAQVLLGVALLAGATAAVRARAARRDTFDGWLHAAVLAWAVIPPLGLITVSVVHPLMVPRYVIGSAPAIALLLAMGVRSLPRPALQGAALVALTAALVAGQVSWHTQEQDDWRGVARQIEAEAKPGDALFLPNPFTRPPLDFLWLDGRNAPKGLVPVTPLDPIGSLPRFYEVPDATDVQLAHQIVDTRFERLWMIDQSAHDLEDKEQTFLRDPQFARTFRVVRTRTYDGEITVYLLERR